MWESTNRKTVVQAGPDIKNKTPISKISRAKWVGGVAQVTEHLPSKHKALSLALNSAPHIPKENICGVTMI
jgi:hypothetical protein